MPTDVQLRFDYETLDSDTREFVQERAERIHEIARITANGIVQIGQHLTEVKDRLGHGRFLDWIEKEFAWKEWTAQQFMKVYRHFKTVNFTDLAIDVSGLYLIAAPSTPEPIRNEAIRRAENGEIVTHAGARALIERFSETGELPNKEINLAEMIAARQRLRQEANEQAKPVRSKEEMQEIEQLREVMKQNSQRNFHLMSVIRAIETLSSPAITMQEAAHEIRNIDTPDKDWCRQARIAESNLMALIKDLP